MSVNFAQDPATRAWLASLPGMGDAFPDMGTPPARNRAAATGIAAGDETKPAGPEGKQEELSFWDLLDVVNPLQHIPIVNHLYRAITGDTIRPPAQILGSTLFGGPLGFAVATATTVVEEANGETLASTVARAFGSEQPVTAQAPTAPAHRAATPGETTPIVPSPAPVSAAPVSSPAIVPTAAAPLASTPPQPAPAAVPSAAAAAAPAPAPAPTPAPARGPTEYFTRLQNPGGSKSLRSLSTPTAPQSLAQAHGAVSAPGQFRPTRIPIMGETGPAPAATVAAPDAPVAEAPAPVAAAPSPAAPVAPPAAPPRPVVAERAAPPAPANADFGRKPSREEVSAQMLRALDRYQAAQRTGDRRVTPAAGGVF